MNYMLAYGSGEASLRLLWKYGLLDILLPFQVDVDFAFNFSIPIMKCKFNLGSVYRLLILLTMDFKDRTEEPICFW